MNFLKIVGNGIIASEPNLKYTTSGKAVCSCLFVSNRKNAKGEKEGTFIELVGFGQLGEWLSKSSKGEKINFVGDFVIDQWEYNGETIRKNKVILDTFDTAPKRAKAENVDYSNEFDSDIPF